jgi:phosphosulfolactate synthase (CoM biosynthesis protein A)
MVDQIGWDLVTPTGTVAEADIMALMDDPDFEQHENRAKELGFELFAKGASIGRAKNIRVRPRFDQWSATGTITIVDQSITKDALEDIMNVAGLLVGLCDWRPSSIQSPGMFGKFETKISKA